MFALESEDIHNEMAKIIFSTDEPTSIERRNGKAATFTWLFGGGVHGLIGSAAQNGIRLDFETARSMLVRLKSRFKYMSVWHNSARVSHQNVVNVSLPWGHRRQILKDQISPSRILNTQVQGRASIGLKEALFEADKRGLIKYIGGLVHDEITATSVPNNEANEYAKELSEAMIEGMQKVCELCPIKVDTDISEEWKP